MKRAPSWDERMLVHVTLNTGESQCVAVAAENFNPAAMVQLRESLPKVPGGAGWEIVRTETPNVPGSIEFGLQRHGKPLSQNMAIRAGDAAIVLKTSRLVAAEGLPPSTLADLEQCAAIALLLVKE